MKKIITKNGRLVIPDNIIIPYIEGDGIGKEITPAVHDIINAAVEKAYGGIRSVIWKEIFAGEKAFRKTGTWLPEETISVFRDYYVGMKGPLTTPVGEGIRSLNVALRQSLDLYVCLRPVRWFKGVDSPVKSPEKVNMVIFRENTEDIYTGIEWMQGTPEAMKFYKFLEEEMGVRKVRFPSTSSFGVKHVSVEGSERLVRAAVKYAIDNKLPSVTLVHKGNIMKFTEGGFKNWGYALAEREFGADVFTMKQYASIRENSGDNIAEEALERAVSEGRVIIKDVITDAFLQNSLLKPEDYSVIATLNLNGDYISDHLAAMVGGIGIAPGANINFNTGHAVFEATHGTAPDIAGRGIADPCSLLLSGVMMLEYLRWNEAADLITRVLEESFAAGKATADLAGKMKNGEALSTESFSAGLVKRIRRS